LEHAAHSPPPAKPSPPRRRGSAIINLILGRPLATSEKDDVKIGVFSAVPAMGLDALSSASYGPEAALTILLPLGAAGLHYLEPITLVIVALLIVLYLSYRQTIAAYPVNGGSYTVAGQNLGRWPGLLAAAALMIDYLLNVAVGISAGVAALVSAAPSLQKYTLPLCLGILALITLLNLRGTGEAGLAFALPTYVFIVSLLTLVGIGLVKALLAGGHPQPVIAPPALAPATAGVGLWIVLRAFAGGCTAMTGVEAVSNGVGAFAEPTVPHAHRTLSTIVAVLTILLLGIATLARAYGIDAMDQTHEGYQSVLSQLTQAVVGRGWFYYVTIVSVLAVLCLSANTSFVDFPRLCRLIASDGFLPHSFAVMGRRLVYTVGVLVLAILAAVLLVVFGGITDRLIPLFAVGAFLAFTLSQAGMVVHWQRALRSGSDQKASTWTAKVPMWINGIGAAATGVALVIILIAKFAEGAWISVLAIPVVLLVFRLIHGRYQQIERQTCSTGPLDLSHNHPPVVLLPTKGWDRVTGKALRLAMWMSRDIVAVHLVNLDGEVPPEEEERIRKSWKTNVESSAHAQQATVPRLDIVAAPYRSLIDPVLRKVDQLKREYPDRIIAIVTPELGQTRWWHFVLYEHRSHLLQSALLARGDHHVVVVRVPWYVND
jgi:amino acid transporter